MAAADLLRYLPPLLLSLLLEDGGAYADEGGAAAHAPRSRARCRCARSRGGACVNQYFWRVLQLGVLVRSALAAGVCRRALR